MRERDTLSAVLTAGNLGDTLCGHIAGRGKALGRIDHRLTDHRAVLQHILQVDQTAVVHMLGKIIRIMKMDDPFLMSLHDIRRQQETLRDILAHFARHIIALHAVDRRILIGILLFYFLIVALQQT